MDNQFASAIGSIGYTLQGDHCTPDLILPKKEYHIGKYGMLRKTFLREHCKGTYSAMLLRGTLYDHLFEATICKHPQQSTEWTIFMFL